MPPPGPPRSGWVQQVAGANRRWRWQFRCRGSRRESAVAQLFSLGGKTRMDVRYTLTLQDHLAWYDHYLATPEGACFLSSLPLVGRFRRWRYSRRVALPP